VFPTERKEIPLIWRNPLNFHTQDNHCDTPLILNNYHEESVFQPENFIDQMTTCEDDFSKATEDNSEEALQLIVAASMLIERERLP
jgi:hypothetical protein